MKRLLILSGKGGTGKTTTAAAFIRFSQTKAIADCDVDAPNLHLVYEQTVKPTVSDFYGGDKAVIDPENALAAVLVKAIAGLMPLKKQPPVMPSMNMPARAAVSVPMSVHKRQLRCIPIWRAARSCIWTMAYFPRQR